MSCSRFCRSFTCVGRILAVCNLAALKNRIAVHPCYGIFSENRIELCRVCSVACNGNDFGSPALEGVCVLSCSRLGRSCACVCRLCAVGNLAALKNRVAVLPCYCVLVDNRIKYCGVCCVTRDVRNSRRPTLENVCILSRSRFCRSFTRVGRLLAVCNLCALKNSVAVHPCYCVLVDNCIKYGCIYCITCNIGNSRRPTLENVCILSRSRFCRSFTRVGRLLAVCNLAALENRIAVLPCYCVLVCNCVKQCIVGRIACDLGNIGRPALKYVCILIGCFFLRCCSVILRSFSIGYFISLKNFIIAFPND